MKTRLIALTALIGAVLTLQGCASKPEYSYEEKMRRVDMVKRGLNPDTGESQATVDRRMQQRLNAAQQRLDAGNQNINNQIQSMGAQRTSTPSTSSYSGSSSPSSSSAGSSSSKASKGSICFWGHNGDPDSGDCDRSKPEARPSNTPSKTISK